MAENYRFKLLSLIILLMAMPCAAGVTVDTLKENEVIAGFKTVTIYENRQGTPMGARFIAEDYNFIVDFLQIESVPQAYFWVKNPIVSNKGEPHLCEHLLLSKGTQGRQVANNASMMLMDSMAWTSSLETSYHFNTKADMDTFYTALQMSLFALLHPDFTDEEIQREAYHIGITQDPNTSSYSIEEEGTIYTEMLSYYEQPFNVMWFQMTQMLYGKEHPYSSELGGHPEGLRKLVPDDLRIYHKAHYHLANMGVVIAIPKTVELKPFLKKLQRILKKSQPEKDSSELLGIAAYNLPAPKSEAEPGTIKITRYPSDNEQALGSILFSWAPQLDYSVTDGFLCDLFMSTFAGGQGSTLYDSLIDSQKRVLDSGARSIYGYNSSNAGHPIQIGLTDAPPAYITTSSLDSVRRIILTELQRLHEYPDNAKELLRFNQRATAMLIQLRKNMDDFLNSPPMFGYYYGNAGSWLEHLKHLEKITQFRKSLVFKTELDTVQTRLESGANIWKELIDSCKLLSTQPYGIGIRPDKELLLQAQEAKQQRLQSFIETLKQTYKTDSQDEALTRYKTDYDAKTAQLKAFDSQTSIGKFVKNPPLTLDDQLIFEEIQLPNKIRLMASTFEQMTAATIGIALNLRDVTAAHLMYVPLLIDIIRDLGVIRNGAPLTYDEMETQISQEIMGLQVYHDFNLFTNRFELVIRGRASEQKEIKQAIEWMETCLFHPNLSNDNLYRLRDIVDQNLTVYRKQLQSLQVHSLALSYRFQDNRLLLSFMSPFTNLHSLLRIKWQLTEPGTAQEQQELADFFDFVRDGAKSGSRETLMSLLDSPPPMGSTTHTKTLMEEFASDARQALLEIPDETLARDWIELCNELKSDLLMRPENVITLLNDMLGSIRTQANTRLFMISNSSDRKAALNDIVAFTNKLAPTASQPSQTLTKTNYILERIKTRIGDVTPLFLAYVNDSKQNSDITLDVRLTTPLETTEKTLIDSLAVRLFGGGGAHSLFMKTWNAGRAYSSGVYYNEFNGLIGYSATKCPDPADTMRFVAQELNQAVITPELTEYAIAQSFYSSAANTYEDRGESIASNCVDGFTPDKIKQYRTQLLKMRKHKNLCEQIQREYKSVLGQIIPGLDSQTPLPREAVYVLLGPESHMQSLQQYLDGSGAKMKIIRVYPRDFWLK